MYIVEGNIGVGKSTFLKLISQNLSGVKVLPEPTENWTGQVFGQSLLDNFYKDPKRWAYTLETLAMICRARDHIREQEKNLTNLVMERSIYSGHYCFALNGYQSGFFTDLEWKIYNEWVDFLLTKKCQAPLGFIYLKADPEMCMKRIQKRSRISETSISLDYIKQIHHWHEKFLIQKENLNENLKNVPVLVLDCNQDFVDNKQNLLQHIASLNVFLSQRREKGLVQERCL
jgi:deoxyadenosine/deoxycytidine kinase